MLFNNEIYQVLKAVFFPCFWNSWHSGDRKKGRHSNRKGKGREEVCFWKKVEGRILLRGNTGFWHMTWTCETMQERHRAGIVFLATGNARRLSVWSCTLLLQSFCINQASQISPNKERELFFLSRQQLGLSLIRPIGPKLLCYTAVNWLKQTLKTQCQYSLFYVTLTMSNVQCSPVNAAWVKSKSFTSAVIHHLHNSSDYTKQVYLKRIALVDRGVFFLEAKGSSSFKQEYQSSKSHKNLLRYTKRY